MPGFAGMDTAEFPGAAEMGWLKANTNLVWCGLYLGPAPSHDSESWMGQRAGLQAAGWGVAPIYVGQQIAGPGGHVVTAAQGTIDGQDAVGLALTEGFTPGSFVYLDLEDGPPFVSPRVDYVNAWAAQVTAANFQAGVYCSHAFAGDAQGLLPSARIWAVRVSTTTTHPVSGTDFPDLDPSGCGYAAAAAWQLGQNCRLSLPGAPMISPLIDLDSAAMPDPGAP